MALYRYIGDVDFNSPVDRIHVVAQGQVVELIKGEVADFTPQELDAIDERFIFVPASDPVTARPVLDVLYVIRGTQKLRSESGEIVTIPSAITDVSSGDAIKADGVWPDRPDRTTVTWIGDGSPDPPYANVGDRWINVTSGVTYISDGLRWSQNPTKLYTGEIRDPALQPFTHTSPWNLPKATDATVLPENERATRHLRTDVFNEGGSGAVTIVPYINVDNVSGFGHPIYRAGIDDPYVDIWDEAHTADAQNSVGAHSGVRVPKDAYPAFLTDAAMGVITPDGRYAWDFAKMLKVGDKSFRAFRPFTQAILSDGQAAISRNRVIESVDINTDTITSRGNGLSTGSPIVITGNPPGGLASGVVYYATSTKINSFKLASSLSAAQSFTAIDITTNVSNGSWERAISSVDPATDTLTSVGHGMATGSPIVFGGTSLASGLSSATTYYVIKVDVDNFKVATSSSNASNNIPLDVLDSTSGFSWAFGDGSQIIFNWLTADTGDSSEDNPFLNTHGGFSRGETYYARDCNMDQFSLASALGGPAIVPTASGAASVTNMSSDITTTNTQVTKNDLYGTGFGAGGRSANVPTFAGMIRAHEVENGVIPHAVAATLYGKYQLRTRSNGNTSAYVWPATSQDAAGYGWDVTATRDATNNTLTLNNHGLEIGSEIKANATNGGFVNNNYYWVVNIIDANTFQVSNNFGGSVLDITASGGISIRLSGAVPLGSYLTLPNSFDLGIMETESGLILATCYRDFGAFVVDSGGSFAMCTIDQDVSPQFTDDLLATRNNRPFDELKKIRDNLVIVDPSILGDDTPNGGDLSATRNTSLSIPLPS